MDIDVDVPGGLAVSSIRGLVPAKASTSSRFNTGATPKSTEKPSVEPVDIFSPAPKPQKASIRSRLGVPRSEPFVFGSPLPQNNTSNLQFRTAAQSVLDEMNKRLAEEGIEAVDVEVLNNRRTSTDEPTTQHESNGRTRVGDMFEKVHQKEFDRMDSITSHYAAKRGAQTSAVQPILSKKRKASLVVKERKPGVPTSRHRPNGSRVASGASAKMLPGDFGGDGDDDDEDADRRMSKRPRVEREEVDAPAQPEKPSLAPPPDPEGEAQKQKEREAVRRRLEHNKAKRRSSMGRPSLGRAPPRESLFHSGTPSLRSDRIAKPARVGFFASAKSLVQNVWNRGAGSKAPSNVPVTKSGQLKEETKTSRITDAKKTIAIPGSSGAPPSGSQTKRIPSGDSSHSLQSNAPGRSTLAPPVISGAHAASSSTLKSPPPVSNLPSLSAAANPRSLTIAGYGQSNTKGGLVGFSSLGKKINPSAHNTNVSSMGAKPNIRPSATSLQKQPTGIPRLRTTSTLMAPTASSLARMSTQRMPTGTAAHNESGTATKASTSSKLRFAMSPQPSATLEQITNSPQSPAQVARPGKIFSQPLSPSPVRPTMPLTTAAASIVGQATEGKVGSGSTVKAGSPSKAKVLPGRRPRISRSKVIARLASQRAAGSGSSGSGSGVARAGGKVRSTMGADAAGKSRQSYAGARGTDVLMSAKKRVRQSEHARRRSRAMAHDGSRMDVD